MTTTYRTRLAALRDPVGVLRQLENKHIGMDSSEYLSSARRITEALREMGVFELVIIKRSRMAVIADLADNVLMEQGIDHLAGDGEARRSAREIAAYVIAKAQHAPRPQ